MLKTFLVFCGALVVCATGLQAQGARSMGASRASFAGRSPSFAARPSAYHGGGRYGGGGYYGHHHGNYGRYYYLGGVPYFYPLGFGFDYPFYGGFGDGFGYGYGAAPYEGTAYNGRIADDGHGQQQAGGSLPEAVQRQLAKRGYYKGSVDGEFGPASKDALSRFQKKQGIKDTGKIDEPTLEALGFTDQH